MHLHDFHPVLGAGPAGAGAVVLAFAARGAGEILRQVVRLIPAVAGAGWWNRRGQRLRGLRGTGGNRGTGRKGLRDLGLGGLGGQQDHGRCRSPDEGAR